MMCNKKRSLSLFLLSLFLSFSVFVSPSHATSSLNGCISDPQCAAVLGLEASYAAPSAAPAGAAAAGATSAANNLIVPAVATAGAAMIVIPWGQEEAEQLANTAQPQAGQCPVPYDIPYSFDRYDSGGNFIDTKSSTVTSPPGGGQGSVYGPINGPYLRPSGQFTQIVFDYILNSGGANTFVLGSVLNGTIENIQFSPSPTDGSPDNCGPVPDVDPSQIPSISPNEETRPFPLVDPTPSQPNSGDEYYSPYTYNPPDNEPYIWVNPDNTVEWRTGPQTIPAPELGPDGQPNQAPDSDPSSDPNNSDSPLNPAPAQSSGCDGWGYAICTFSNKFPFDVIGTLPELGEEPSCPSFTFFGQSMEFCFVRLLLRGLKWVVWVGLSIKMLVNL